jgi:hypothetical protein
VRDIHIWVRDLYRDREEEGNGEVKEKWRGKREMKMKRGREIWREREKTEYGDEGGRKRRRWRERGRGVEWREWTNRSVYEGAVVRSIRIGGGGGGGGGGVLSSRRP